MEKNDIVKTDKNSLKTIGDKYIDKLAKESENVMKSMGLELKPEVKNALFNLGLACEKTIKDKKITWEQVSKDGLASKLLYYAQLNLNPANNELYIIPYRNGEKYVLNFEESYLGKQKKVKKFSVDDLVSATAFLVRDGDIYEPNIDLLTGDTLTYKPKPFNTGNIIGAVCFLKYENETKNRVVEMSLDELNQVKEASKQKMGGTLSPAWRNWESEMYKKAVLKRALKDVPIEVPVEYQNAYMNTEEIDNSNYELDFDERKTVVVETNEDVCENPNIEECKVEQNDSHIIAFE